MATAQPHPVALRPHGHHLNRCASYAGVVTTPLGAVLRGAPTRRRPEAETAWTQRAAHALGAPWLVTVALALAAAGAAAVYAATYAGLLSSGSSPYRYMIRDLLNLAVAIGLGAAASAIGYRTVCRYGLVAFGAAVGALVLVLSPLGTKVNGANAWFALGPVQLEPSQLSVLAGIILLARLLDDPRAEGAKLTLRRVALPLLLVALAALLILAEPALGMALVLVAVVAAVVALSGLTGKAMLVLVAAAVALVLTGMQLHVVKPYQQQRLTAFLHPDSSTSSGYQTSQSMIAVGSGGTVGKGFLQGAQTNGSFVPEQRTDFVFTVVAEETGFVGSIVLLGLLSALSLGALRIAARARERVGQLLATGVGVWFAVQTFVNVGMALGLMPVTGIPLPFISYGGSGLFVDVVAVGLVCSVAREQRSKRRDRGATKLAPLGTFA